MRRIQSNDGTLKQDQVTQKSCQLLHGLNTPHYPKSQGLPPGIVEC